MIGDSMDNIKKLVQDSSITKCVGVIAGLNALVNNSSYQSIKNIAENSIAFSFENSSLSVLQKEIQQRQEIMDSCFKGSTAALEAITPALESYNRIAELTCVSREMAELLQPLSTNGFVLQNITPMTDALSQLGELSTLVMNKPSLLTHLHSALESQIDTSLWDYWDNAEAISDDDIDSVMGEELVEIVTEENKEGLIQQFVSRYGEKGKKLLVKLVKWLIGIFMGELLTFYCEPIYKMMVPSVLLQEPSIESTQAGEIPADTEIHVWSDVANDYIEISYVIEEKEYQGYILKEEFDNKSQKISNEIKWEHVVFINDVVELLAEKWNIECETVYKFLNEDTMVMNDYIMEHYDVLCFIDKGEVVNLIEQYCKKENITIPK